MQISCYTGIETQKVKYIAFFKLTQSILWNCIKIDARLWFSSQFKDAYIFLMLITIDVYNGILAYCIDASEPVVFTGSPELTKR